MEADAVKTEVSPIVSQTTFGNADTVVTASGTGMTEQKPNVEVPSSVCDLKSGSAEANAPADCGSGMEFTDLNTDASYYQTSTSNQVITTDCNTTNSVPLESVSEENQNQTSDGQESSNNCDPNVQAADSNSPKQTFIPCKVCGDKASGYHYGVTSCEGCKGFFRRSIQKQIEYRCLREGKCMVIRLNRNRCQYCRFKKCLAVGMSRDSVRYGRVPKRSRSTEDQRVTTSGSDSSTSTEIQANAESRQLAIYDIILTISQAHHAHSEYTEDKVKTLAKKPVSLLPSMDTINLQNTAESLESQRLACFSNLAVLITPSIQKVVEFAKRVPGFPEIAQDNQLILIKAGFFEIWLTRISRMFSLTDRTLVFADGSIIAQEHLEIIYSPDFVKAMFEYAHTFSQLSLNDTEIGLLTGIILATSDRAGLNDPQAVEKIQDRLIEALKLQMSRNHTLEPQLFANVLMKLPELRSLGSHHNEHIQWFRSHWARLKLPPLFAEIYDIIKNEEA